MEQKVDAKKVSEEVKGCCGGSCSDRESCCSDQGDGGECNECCCSEESGKNDDAKKIQEELAQEYLNGWKRCQADFENYKRNKMNIQQDLATVAVESFSLKILSVLDNFHASIEHVPQDQKESAWVQGILYIMQQLETTLSEVGVESMGVKEGDVFDPSFHDAIEKDSSSKAENGNINKVLQQGYRYKGRTLRAARVVVSA